MAASPPIDAAAIIIIAVGALVWGVLQWGSGPLCRSVMSADAVRRMRLFCLWVLPVFLVMGLGLIFGLHAVNPQPDHNPRELAGILAVLLASAWVGHFIGWWRERPRPGR